MKFTTALLAAALLLATSAISPVLGKGGGRTPSGTGVPQVDVHCETRCTLDHETCESDASEMIDECENNCGKQVCSKCEETMDPATLGQCHSQCGQCLSQCDTTAEPKRQACDTNERQCLSKCTRTE